MNEEDENKQQICITFNNKDSLVSSCISYLVAALSRQGIHAFVPKDGDELDTDKFKHFLVVFSEDHTFSSPCLDNLAKLVDFRCMNRHVMLVPVFYGVSLSSLKQQFCENIAMCSEDQISRWRKALEETTSLQSHEYNEHTSNEAEFVEEIARNVFEMLNPTKEIGIHRQQSNIENLLCKQPWGLRTIGISGKPRIGKTVLANALFRGMSSSYDASCLIKDFHIQYNSKKLQPLTNDYFTKIPMEKFDLNSKSEPVSYRQKRVLFVLDDVRNADDAMAYLGLFNRFSPGSLIIITSRGRQVLEKCFMNEIYEVQGLNDEDALKLFTRSVFGNNEDIDDNLLNLVKKVVKMCGGNPSTLISYAQKLKGKSTLEIKHELTQICNYECIKKTQMCLVPKREEDNDLVNEGSNYTIVHFEEIPEFDIPGRVRESLPSDFRVYHLGHDPEVQRVLFEELLSCEFQKTWQEYNKSFPCSSSLKKIELENIETLVDVEALPEARSVEEINLRHCRSMESIPVTDELKNLQVFNLSGCNGITRFPEFVRRITELNLEGTGIREIKSETSEFSILVRQKSCSRSELPQRLSEFCGKRF